MRDRTKNLVVKIDEEERAKLAALEDADDENASRLVRKWIALNYAARFGNAPATKAKAARS
jgi:hypothetical protein